MNSLFSSFWSQDAELRQSIRWVAITGGKILDSIGTTQMERDIVKNVTRLSREHKDTIESQSGVKSSINENEIGSSLKRYCKNLKKKKPA